MLLLQLSSRFFHAIVIFFGLSACSMHQAGTESLTVKLPFDAEAQQPFGIDDYFKIRRVTELALSSDGSMIVYGVESASLEPNKAVRTVYVSATASDAEPILIDDIQTASSFAWIPGTHELAYLSSDGDVTQLYSININNNKLQQHTDSVDPVIKFRFAPNGGALVWLSQAIPANESSPLYGRLVNGEEGVVIDSENVWVNQFIDPEWPDFVQRPLNALWLKRPGAETFEIKVPGQVKIFYWSSSGENLSISYAANDLPKEAFYDVYTSLGIFDVTKKTFWALADSRLSSKTKKTRYYTGGEWVPGANRLLVRRLIEQDFWVKTTEGAIVNVRDRGNIDDKTVNWNEMEIYGYDPEPAFMPVKNNILYSNKTIHARQSLYQITPSGIERASILQDVEDSISFVQFSTDFETVAFVNESLTRPPEVYIWRKGLGLQKLTHFNQEISNKQLPNVREVTWKSKDGVTVQGWLFEPVGRKLNINPMPLITFVHGGPSLAVADEFAFYSQKHGGLWPYPFIVYALHDMAVFVPNYRGSKTFGDKYSNPTSMDNEPVDDIVSGIDYLIDEGIADPGRLAISGHSHGAWLGSLVMTRAKIFRAGSFAEGIQNSIVAYSLMPGYVNRDVHDVKLGAGASLYDDPQRYIDLSPDLHFEGLDTAVLFEAGAKSLAINMMGSPKAAQRAGMPAEFIVYPQTGHNIRLPRLQKESAERNLDWMRFWLKGEEDPNPEKAEQYERWRAMRDERCTSEEFPSRPGYCLQ